MSSGLRALRFGHVTYTQSCSALNAYAPQNASVVLAETGLETPAGKLPFMNGEASRYGLTLINGAVPIEVLSFDGASIPEFEPRLLPTEVDPRGRVSLLSRSFTPAFSDSLCELLHLREPTFLMGGGDSPRKLTLRERETAPPFEERLDVAGGPVSLAIYCRGIHQCDFSSTGGPAFGATVAISSSVFSIVMTRVEDVWVELLERLQHDRA